MADNLDFVLQIKPEDADDEEVDLATRRLYEELQELPIDQVSLGRGGDVPAGAKAGEFVALGTLTLSLAPVVVPALVELLKSWLGRKEGRSVVIRKKRGNTSTEIEIKAGLSEASIAALLKDLSLSK